MASQLRELQSVQKSWFVVVPNVHMYHCTSSSCNIIKTTFRDKLYSYECLFHVREPDDIGSINHKGGVGNHIFIIFSHLEL